MSDCPFTMEEIKLRCASCEPGECWDWRGTYLHDGRRPVIAKRMDTDNGRTNKQFYARHLVMWLTRGERPDLGLFRAIVTTCDNPCCVNPEHLKVVSRKTVVRKVAATGIYSSQSHRMKVANARRRSAKLSEEAVKDIRDSEDPAKVAAEKHGVTAAYVYMLRRGEFRQDYSNPFAGLM
jgi:hypothetical protein